MTPQRINLITEAVLLHAKLVTFTELIVWSTFWINRKLNWKPLISLIKCCNVINVNVRIWIIRYFHHPLPVIKFPIRDTPVKTKLTLQNDTQWLTGSVSLKYDPNNGKRGIITYLKLFGLYIYIYYIYICIWHWPFCVCICTGVNMYQIISTHNFKFSWIITPRVHCSKYLRIKQNFTSRFCNHLRICDNYHIDLIKWP